MKTRNLLFLSVFLTAVAPSGAATIIADYGFDGEVLSSQDADPDTLAGDLVDGGITGSTLTFETRQSGVRGNPVPSLFWTVGAYNDGTVLDSDYLSITIAPNSGFQIDFTSLSVDHFNSTNAGATVYFFSDQAGFGSLGDAIGTVFLDDYDDTGNFNASVSLAGLATATAATEFRIYFATTASFGAGEVWTDNIILEGTVTGVPEPSAFALIGLGGLMFSLRRRRAAK